MKKVVLITVLLSLFSSLAYAQSEDGKASSGSVYSKLGVGYPVSTGNVAAQSMGLMGISFNDPFVNSLANPAQWGNTVYGVGSGGVGLNSYSASDANQSVRNSSFSVNQFQLQFPIIRGKLGISGAFAPVTESSFRTFSEETRFVGNGAQQDTLNIDLENRGSGGINKAEFGVGWKITPSISVGYAASVVFMSMDDAYTASFPGSNYRPANYTIESNGVGFGNRFGTLIQLPGPLDRDDQLGIGASVTFPVSLNAERQQTGTVSNGAVTLTNDLPNGDGTIRLPTKLTGGLSYSPSNLLMVGLEGLYEGWSNYENELKPGQQEEFVDRYKLGLGMQYFPYLTGSDKFLSTFKYRAGMSYDSGHLQLEGQRINTLKFSLGLGIRSPNSRSSIDLSFEYGVRGTNSTNLVKEQIFGMKLSLNLAEVMFYRPKLQ